MRNQWVGTLIFLLGVSLAPAQEKKTILEEIIARVNNEVITTSELARARASLRQEVEQDCQGCPSTEVDSILREREENLLRDLIDQSLLVQRGKDIGLNVEPDVVKQLDAIRQRNNLPSMEALDDELRKAGLTPEDYKANIRNGLLSQEVIRRQVIGPMQFTSEEVRKYYDEHPDEFVREEKVYLSEIFITTEGKAADEISLQEQRARVMHDRLRRGEEFGELAKRFSDGTTALQGGELGGFERGQLDPELAKIVFQLKRGDTTDVIRTSTGFLILRVDLRYEKGLQPLDRVENEVMNRLYGQRMPTALRAFLRKLRQESYVTVKPGYVDTSAVAYHPIEEVPQGAGDDGKKKKKKKKKGE